MLCQTASALPQNTAKACAGTVCQLSDSWHLPVAIWALCCMLFQLLPCLLSKIEHVLIAVELKALCELRQKLHASCTRGGLRSVDRHNRGAATMYSDPRSGSILGQLDLDMLFLRLPLNLCSQHLLKCFPVFSCFF